LKSEGRSDHSSVEPAAHSQGTTIEVRDLFFNVPARRKYLRTERTEFYQIQQLVRHFAISHPELAVRLSHNGRQILNLKYVSGDDGAKRVHGVYGARFMQHAIRLASQERALRISGWIGKAEAARTMNDSQFFCLNGRCIRMAVNT
jgi:DNA mismatch repair protein MutL